MMAEMLDAMKVEELGILLVDTMAEFEVVK
jgi:hypothetical protein